MKIAVALSGGFDSFFTALILKENSDDVYGVTFTVKGIFDGKRAKEAGEIIGIKVYEVDITEEFLKNVIEPFVEFYIKGLTPNPCALCNRKIKAEIFLKKALSLERAKYLATGHYTEKVKVGDSFTLKEHKDYKKSQTYFLSLLKRESLNNLLFPLKDYNKEYVKEFLISKHPDFFKDLKESFEVCFVKNKKYYNFIRKKIRRKSHRGVFLNEKGEVIGHHSGYYKYTIGQRRGLRISKGEKLYVYKISPKENAVYLGKKERVFSDKVKLSKPNFFLATALKGAYLRVRYKGELSEIVDVEEDGNGLILTLSKPVFAVTPGQISAFYLKDKETLIGGGIIKS